jgi:hypothetical protein
MKLQLFIAGMLVSGLVLPDFVTAQATGPGTQQGDSGTTTAPGVSPRASEREGSSGTVDQGVTKHKKKRTHKRRHSRAGDSSTKSPDPSGLGGSTGAGSAPGKSTR